MIMMACVPCCRAAGRVPSVGEVPSPSTPPAVAVVGGESVCPRHLRQHLNATRTPVEPHVLTEPKEILP